MRNKVVMALAATIVCAAAAQAIEYPKIQFDATYQSTAPQGTTQMRMVSDGKGHMRVESTASGQKFISISDYPNKMLYSIIEAQHMVMRMPLKDQPEQPQIHDEESAKRANAKSLGAKVVNGHPAHGYEYSTPNGTTVVWIGDDIHYMVRSEMTTKDGTKVVTDLKQWSAGAPSANDFQVPSGYKVMEVPSYGGR
jgi:hypothetical protein